MAMSFALISALASQQQSEPGGLRDYAIETSHSSVAFSIGFLHTTVHGRFNTFRGAVLFDAKRPEQSSVTIVIDAKSIDTGSDFRDEHLRSEDFFDVDAYPTIRFQSTGIHRTRNGFLVSGPLTIHGVTRSVDIPFEIVQAPASDVHATAIGNFVGALRISRKDFGIVGGDKHNNWFDAVRSATLRDSVQVSLDVQVWAADFERPGSAGIEQGVQRARNEGVDSMIRSARTRLAANPKALDGQEWAIDQVARSLIARGQPGEGLKLLRFNAELFPKSSDAQTSLGHALQQTGDRAGASASYEEALRLDADNPRAIELRRRLPR